MKNLKSAIALATVLALASGVPAGAQDEAGGPPDNPHYQITGTIEGTMIVGGVGDEVFGGSWNETLTFSSGGNSTEITGQCIGMDTPSDSTFDRQFTCTLEDGNGQSGAVIYGCKVTEGASNEMRCYGHFEGKEGGVAGRYSLRTAYYVFGPDGTGTVVGSGQWYK